MSKTIIVEALKEAGFGAKEATLAVETVLSTIETKTAEEGKFTIVGHGTYEVRERAARKGRNPQTGAEIEIAASKTPGFKPGKNFKQIVANK